MSAKVKEPKAATRLVHAGRDRDPFTGASSMPVYQATTYAQADPDAAGPWFYARAGNPTRQALELAIAELEGGARGLAFGSGMAAISAALFLLKPGDRVIAGADIYGGTYRILTGLLARWGVVADFVDTTDPDAVRAAVRPETRALFVETPANPLLQITDLRAMAAIAKKHGLLSIIDNTFMTPWLQRPIEFGFDMVLHSATKFLGGHSDVLAGLAVAADEELGNRLFDVLTAVGGVLGPWDSWLVLRGMKTLGARMDRQQAGAETIAAELRKWPEVRRVFYPTLSGHPGREVHLAQAGGGGAVVSFELKDGAAAKRALARVRLCLPAVSLGGVESILSHPPTMSHRAMPPAVRRARGINDGLLRLSVGLEDPEDLLADLRQAVGSQGRKLKVKSKKEKVRS